MRINEIYLKPPVGPCSRRLRFVEQLFPFRHAVGDDSRRCQRGVIKLRIASNFPLRAFLRTEAASNNVNDYGVKKSVQNLPALRNALSAINNNYLNVQQDILETFIDRGQLRRLVEPTSTPAGKRIPGLRLDHRGNSPSCTPSCASRTLPLAIPFTTAEIYPHVVKALECPSDRYKLGSLRYDLSKLRAKGLVTKSKLSPLSTPPARIFNLSGLPEALRAHLYATCRRPSQPRQRRCSNPPAKPISARTPLSACRR